jgi:chemotaxis signal transduction protein
MAQYKGIELPANLVKLVKYMESAESTREAMQALQGVWDTLSMLGKLSGTGVEIEGIRSAFASLSVNLLHQLVLEARKKTEKALQAKAQVSIDILVRNLFERTADIGFFATDTDLRAFMQMSSVERQTAKPQLLSRLQEYQQKYSVYADIVMIDPGEEIALRLDSCHQGQHCRDSFVKQALASNEAYTETFGTSDLCPNNSSLLIYSSKIMSLDQRRVTGVLALVFRFEDESKRIFSQLITNDDWTVLALLNDREEVMTSSDLLQIPLGSFFSPPPALAATENTANAADISDVIQFAGRRWMRVRCQAMPYQGYKGPGWFAQAVVPLEHAFEEQENAVLENLPARLMTLLTSSAILFSEDLRRIPGAATHIESELNRAVWNGNVALGHADASQNVSFSRSLLREIGLTGVRTREVFTRAINLINSNVLSNTLEDGRARTALAIDIMDRNLYERANDCRWWALTTVFREMLEKGALQPQQLKELRSVLQTIHGLYTVYANLVLFDSKGRMVAASVENESLAYGQLLKAEWIQRTLILPSTQAYAVSKFEVTDLYNGQPTYIYCAAIRGLQDPRLVVGGIAVVFDSTPQFAAILQDALPARLRSITSLPDVSSELQGASAFIDQDGKVISSSHPQWAVGEKFPVDLRPLKLTSQGSKSLAHIFSIEGRPVAVCATLSQGYREYKSPQDSYQNQVTAVMCLPLSEANEAQALSQQPIMPPELTTQPLFQDKTTQRLDLASFAVLGQWYALPALQVEAAIDALGILPLPHAPAYVKGSVIYQEEPILVISLEYLLHGIHSAQLPAQAQIVVAQLPRSSPRKRVGLLVDALGDTPEIALNRLEPLTQAYRQTSALIEHVVKPASLNQAEGNMLMVLSMERLGTILG